MQSIKEPVTVFWFRRDLRLTDNHGLFKALKGTQAVLPIFIFDTQILDGLADKNDRRVGFIHQSLQAVNSILQSHGSSLLVVHGTPLHSFQKLCDQFVIKEVIANHDYEPYALDRDDSIQKYLAQKGIPFTTYKDQVIFEKGEVVKPDGEPYTMYFPYSKTWKKKLASEKPLPYPSEQLLGNLVKNKNFPFPTIQEIGFEETEKSAPYVLNEETVRTYHQTRDQPGVAGTSHLSVHLRFGTVSVRQAVQLAMVLNEKWLDELIWREFFMMILFHFPHVVQHSFKKKFDAIPWRNNEAEFKTWCAGETGYPLVDAGMRQLNETGWMHNRARIVVASFLVKHLLIDWRWGEAYFAQKLVDYELASNNGNWQWVAGGGCDASPYFRVFNPQAQAQKFDPEQQYIKSWIKDYHPGYLPAMVDHEYARKRALSVYKNALAGN